MIKTAEFSKDRKYRYTLWRIWDEKKPYVMFICLNPSTADETEDDPTVRRCIGFAERWGYGAVCMTNLFAYRATDYKKMKSANNPIGEENDKYLKKIAKDAAIIVAAWSNHGTFMNRSKQVRKILPNLHYLKLNKSGEPSHPLYLRGGVGGKAI